MAKSDMHAGMANRSPKAVDASMKPGSGKVDNGAVRPSVAPTPKTLGPRDA